MPTSRPSRLVLPEHNLRVGGARSWDHEGKGEMTLLTRVAHNVGDDLKRLPRGTGASWRIETDREITAARLPGELVGLARERPQRYSATIAKSLKDAVTRCEFIRSDCN